MTAVNELENLLYGCEMVSEGALYRLENKSLPKTCIRQCPLQIIELASQPATFTTNMATENTRGG